MTNTPNAKHAILLISVAILTLANVGAPQIPAAMAPTASEVQVLVPPYVEERVYVDEPYAMESTGAPAGDPKSAQSAVDEDLVAERELRRYFASVRGARPPLEAVPTLSVVPSGSAITSSVVVPVLMYHHVAVAGPNADAVRRDLSVSPANFAAQMAYLERNGYTSISLADLDDRLERGRPLPARPIVLTFDDGYEDNYSWAFPALLRSGMTGTFFLITDFVGKGEYMGWDQARVMLAGGMSVESHTLDHPDLATLSGDRLARQLSQSKATLERELGSSVSFLSYPAGKYNAAVMRAAQQAGYRAAVTTVYGDSHQAGHPFEISRLRIRGSDDLETFAAKVGGPAPNSLRSPLAK